MGLRGSFEFDSPRRRPYLIAGEQTSGEAVSGDLASNPGGCTGTRLDCRRGPEHAILLPSRGPQLGGPPRRHRSRLSADATWDGELPRPDGLHHRNSRLASSWLSSTGLRHETSRCVRAAPALHQDRASRVGEGRRRTTTVRAYDDLIAATAVANDLPVLTLNVDDFSGITSLTVVEVVSA